MTNETVSITSAIFSNASGKEILDKWVSGAAR